MTRMLYRIKDWPKHFENNRTRDLLRMTFVCVPNKQDGDGYTELLDHPDGVAHYGAWMAIILAASKCGTRGTLLRGTGEPHDARSLSRMTRVPVAIIQATLPRLVSIGWIEAEVLDSKGDAEIPQVGAEKCAASDVQTAGKCPEWNGMEWKEQNGTEGNSLCGEASQATTSPPATVELSTYEFPTRGKRRTYTLPLAKLDEYLESFPGLDVHRELTKAVQWCRDNEARRKTAGGMPKFIGSWLGRACDQTTGPPPGGTLSDKTRRSMAAGEEILSELFSEGD
jgi:hypothetical protein